MNAVSILMHAVYTPTLRLK